MHFTDPPSFRVAPPPGPGSKVVHTVSIKRKLRRGWEVLRFVRSRER